MGRMTGIKWDKVTQCRPVHNIASSDFSKYYPQPWKFMDGEARIELLLSNEYQRMWIRERELWQKRMYADSMTLNVDIIKRYVTGFRSHYQPGKQEKKEPFKMKKFQSISGKINTVRPPDDKAVRGNKKSPNLLK